MKFVLSCWVLLFSILFDLNLGEIQDQILGEPRKVSGEAGAQKAQEYVEISEEISRLLGGYPMDTLPYPPPIIPSVSPSFTHSSSTSITKNAFPPSTVVMPPSIRPTEGIGGYCSYSIYELSGSPFTSPPNSPIPITTITASTPNKTTVVIQLDAKTTVSVEIDESKDLEELDRKIDDFPSFDHRNVEEKPEIQIDDGFRSDENDFGNDIEEVEKSKEVKEIINNAKYNASQDYYVTSPATKIPVPPSPSPLPSPPPSSPILMVNDTIEETSIDFNHLFEKAEESGNNNPIQQLLKKASEKKLMEIKSTKTPDAFPTPPTPTPKVFTPPSSSPTTSTPPKITNPPHFHTRTCIHVDKLKKIDDITKIDHQRLKKDRIEVSVEVEESEDSESESESPPDSESETRGEAKVEILPDESEKHKSVSRKIRNQNGNGRLWKKFEMDCDDEEDEKGQNCKLWAASGLCLTHKPTMFLFCRKTCLCVGPN